MNYNKPIISGYYSSILQDLTRETFCSSQIKIEYSNTYRYFNPSIITNAIILINKFNEAFFDKTIYYLKDLLCKHVVIDVNFNLTLKEFQTMLNIFEYYNIHSSIFKINYADQFYSDEFAEILLNSNRYQSIILYESPFDKNLENTIFYYKLKKRSKYSKSQTQFISNRFLFAESQLHNTYFNRKLFIGENGEIKNAPESEETFGSIHDLNSSKELKEIIQQPAFQKYWYIHKEISDVCQNCEFRHMCVDNRLPYKRKENEWYHKTECNYNPYITKWKNEDGYRTLSECSVISDENGFSIDHEKVATINEKLWG
jgi:hypothetical protein